jgi:AcrR family transcriptional regulator
MISRLYMAALKTFNNLTVERQEEIINVCLKEFSFHEYQSASLSTIVSNLNLAKGSFYRYFENKESLYLFLFEHCIGLRFKYDEAFIKNPPDDAFELIIRHFEAKIMFEAKYPLPSAFLYSVLHEKNNEILGGIQQKSSAMVLDYIKQLVVVQIGAGVIREDLDIDKLAFMIMHIQIIMTEYIELKYQLNFRDNIRNTETLHSIPHEELMIICKDFVEILKNGIVKK